MSDRTTRPLPSCPNCRETEMTSTGPKCGCTAGEMAKGLHENPERDGFRSESPIRAFTTWVTQGNYALGKGFRPSLQHMIPYMDALDRVENWKLLQVLESATLTPSFLFHREPEMSFDELDHWLKNKGFVLAADPDGCVRLYEPLDYQRQKIEPITRAHTAMSRAAEALDAEPDTNVAEKVACGLRQLAQQMQREIRQRTWPNTRKNQFYTFCDRINGHAYELEDSVPEAERIMPRPTIELDGFGEPHVPTPTYDTSQRDYGDENPEPRPDAIPSGIYWSTENDNFYSSVTHQGQGTDFYDEWYERRAEFPGDPRMQPAISTPDDPVNPKHYGGTACAEIGERMTANSYQVLKYNWRLGEKDDPVIELGKAIWYLDREIVLYRAGGVAFPGGDMPKHSWLDHRLKGRSAYVKNVAHLLYSWNRYENLTSLQALRTILLDKKAEHEVCTTGLAV